MKGRERLKREKKDLSQTRKKKDLSQKIMNEINQINRERIQILKRIIEEVILQKKNRKKWKALEEKIAMKDQENLLNKFLKM